MIRRGILWGIIISIPFWLLAIWLIKSDVITLKTLMIVVLVLSAPYVFLIMRSPQHGAKDQPDWDIAAENDTDNTRPPLQSTSHQRDPSDTGTPD